MKQTKLHVQAHRGASSELPENTVGSVVRAVEIGADSVEIDIQLLQDDRFLVVHDFHFGSTRISGLSSADSFCESYPFLEDVFGALRKTPSEKKDFFLDLEIKRDPTSPSGPDPDKIAMAFLQTLEREKSAIPIVVRSFDWEILRKIKKISPQQAITPLMTQDFSLLEEAFKISSDWIAAPKEALDSQKINKIKAANKKLMVYTVNIPSDWQKWIDEGADGITTDYPRELLNMLNRSLFK